MEVSNIPLIITNFNQLSYLRNLVNQFHFYYPENQIWILDNGSTYKPLLKYYDQIIENNIEGSNVNVKRYESNDFITNLNSFLNGWFDSEYYIISDPDISIHPTTPPNFLEIFKAIIDSGVHHVGFDLIYEDIPSWNKKAGWIQGDEKELHKTTYEIELTHTDEMLFGTIPIKQKYTGWKAALDTTFCMFKKSNGGWSAPMPPEHWSNSVRMFSAHHLSWYLHPDHLNDEMQNYFATCKRFEPGMISAGQNNYRPE